MESTAHRTLKRLAGRFLRAEGWEAVAGEVCGPLGRFRVDVAGYRDSATGAPPPRRRRRPSSPGREPRTVVVECKRTRGDFLRDQASAARLLAEREQLHRLARAIERDRIMSEEPHLARGRSLFPELDDWDFASSRSPGYRQVLRRLRRLDLRLYGQTKFCVMARYRLADVLYLAAPRGLIRRRELPMGWGLLECPPQWLDDPHPAVGHDEPPRLEVAVEAPPHDCRHEHRLRLLRNIAVAATRGE